MRAGPNDPPASNHAYLSRRLDVGRPDDLAPFLGLFGNELAKIGRRAGHQNAAQLSEPNLQLRIGERVIDGTVERHDGIGRRVSWHAEAEPVADLITRHEI